MFSGTARVIWKREARETKRVRVAPDPSRERARKRKATDLERSSKHTHLRIGREPLGRRRRVALLRLAPLHHEGDLGHPLLVLLLRGGLLPVVEPEPLIGRLEVLGSLVLERPARELLDGAREGRNGNADATSGLRLLLTCRRRRTEGVGSTGTRAEQTNRG